MKRTDNGNLPAKLALRRYFLEKYHGDTPPRVMDCCQGSGVIWSVLRKEFRLGSYWGLDEKPKPGRLKIDSARVLAQSGWRENVIDVDTYGSPWKHWAAMLPNVAHPVTAFLTIGQVMMGTDKETLAVLGLGKIEVPPGIAVRLHDMALNYLLTMVNKYDIVMSEAKEAVSFGNARYIGVRLEPQGGK